jgi:hypothetical protein
MVSGSRASEFPEAAGAFMDMNRAFSVLLQMVDLKLRGSALSGSKF